MTPPTDNGKSASGRSSVVALPCHRNFLRHTRLLSFVFSPLPSAWAAEGTHSAYTSPSAVSSGSMVQIIFSLLLVLAAIVLVAWLLKRMNLAQQGSIRALKVLGGVAIGQRERIVLVEIKNTWLIIGVCPGQISTLHTLEKPDDIAQGTANDSQSTDKPKNFSAALSSALSSFSSVKTKQQLKTDSHASDRSQHVP